MKLRQLSLSSELSYELTQHIKDQSILKILTQEVHTKEDLQLLKETTKKLASELNKEIFCFLKEEVKEISEDFSFSNTKRGKYILEVNQWLESFYDEFRQMHQFDNIFIGCHIKEYVIFITGKLDENSAVSELDRYIHSKLPPFRLKFQLE